MQTNPEKIENNKVFIFPKLKSLLISSFLVELIIVKIINIAIIGKFRKRINLLIFKNISAKLCYYV